MRVMHDLTTLGEIMLRYSVPAGERLERARTFDVGIGGAEANVASLLARLGHSTACVTALPDSALGRLGAAALREAGVDLSGVLWRETGRMGTYYVEFSEPPRPASVIYDRANSCAAQLTLADLPLDLLLDTRLLYLTGITPPLSASLREAVRALAEMARARGVPLAVDANYRSRLWSTEDAAAELNGLMQGAALVLCKAADARLLFGLRQPVEALPAALAERFSAQAAVVTNGGDGVVAWRNGQTLHEPAIAVRVLDRIGAGDAMAAGVLRGWLRGDLAYGLRAGVMLAALALTQHGDHVITTTAELEALLADHSSDVQR